MKQVSICVENYVFEFYKKAGENAGGVPAEKVMADKLFMPAEKIGKDS